MRKFFQVFVFAAALAGLIVSSAKAQFFFMEHPLVGAQAPEFELPNLKAEKQVFSKISGGKDTILFFWATWCPHCREQLKEMKGKAEDFKKDSINVLLVDLGEDARVVQAYLDKNKLDFQVLLDGDGNVSEDYKVLGIPTFIFIDKTGKVRGVENSLPDSYRSYYQAAKPQ